MYRSRFLPSLFSAGLVLAAACSDAVAPTPPIALPSQPIARPGHELVTLSGSVHLSGKDVNPVVLSTSDGQEIPLTGADADMLTSLENAGVEVRGWTYNGAVEVVDFLVRTVNDATVIDGTLIALYDVPTATGDPIGYAIRTTRGGATVALTDPPADLIANVGKRLWVAATGDGSPTSFGIISKFR